MISRMISSWLSPAPSSAIWRHNLPFKMMRNGSESRAQPQFNIQFTLGELLARRRCGEHHLLWPKRGQTRQCCFNCMPSDAGGRMQDAGCRMLDVECECLTRSTWRVTAKGACKVAAYELWIEIGMWISIFFFGKKRPNAFHSSWRIFKEMIEGGVGGLERLKPQLLPINERRAHYNLRQW